MAKTIVYKRNGKFGPEFLIPVNYFPILEKKETPKALCCGEYNGFTYKNGDPVVYVYGWIPKSQIVEIKGEGFSPSWITDNWKVSHLMMTERIFKDAWKHEEFEVKDM